MRAHERLIYLSKNRGTPISDSEMRAILQPLNERDAKNQERLDQLVSECGWPTYGKFGATPPYAASSVALHAPLPFKLKYLPMIEASFRRGEIPATRYAQYVDKVLSSQNKPQLYGYQLSLDRGGATTILPVEDPVHLNDRRQAIGLPPHPDFPMPTNWPGNSVERSPGMHNKTGATPK